MTALLNTKQFFMDIESADVKFIFDKDDGSIPAHKIILSSASSVFKAMFYGGLAEKGDVKIVDASIDAFKTFIDWIYSNEMKLTTENVDEVLYLSKKYDTEKCSEACSTFLDGITNKEHFWFTFELAVKYDLEKVIDKCEEIIPSAADDLLSSEFFLESSRALLKKTLTIASLTNKAKFDACMKWSRNAAMQKNIDPNDMEKRRELLGECVGLIKFTKIPSEDLLPCFKQTFGLFTKEEMHNLLLEVIEKHALEKNVNVKKCSYCNNTTSLYCGSCRNTWKF